MSVFKPPKMPKNPGLPQSPLDKMPISSAADEAARNYRSLISTSPMGQTKPALGQKKTLLGGAK